MKIKKLEDSDLQISQLSITSTKKLWQKLQFLQHGQIDKYNNKTKNNKEKKELKLLALINFKVLKKTGKIKIVPKDVNLNNATLQK